MISRDRLQTLTADLEELRERLLTRAARARRGLELGRLKLELRVRRFVGILRSPADRQAWAGRLLYQGCRLLLAATLPLWLLLASPVFIHGRYGLSPWLALAAGVTLTTLLLIGYTAWISKRLTGRARVGRPAGGIVPGLVMGYCVYVLIYLSMASAKTEDVRNEYRSLHPLLRVAVGTLALLDGEAVITDLSREPEDYHVMGLAVNPVSPHYRQPDGYAHAVDLRTRGRAWWKNLLMEAYFRSMGFSTLRHTGTADHLHVSLSPSLRRGSHPGTAPDP